MKIKNVLMIKNRNKRGWIKIVEVFAAILIIAGVVLIVITQSRGAREDIYTRLHNDQIFILRDIQLNNSLRSDVLGTFGTVEWNDFPTNLKADIETRTPNYMNCSAKICTPDDLCLLSGSEDVAIYAESVLITATQQTYNPRQLKLFCWVQP